MLGEVQGESGAAVDACQGRLQDRTGDAGRKCFLVCRVLVQSKDRPYHGVWTSVNDLWFALLLLEVLWMLLTSRGGLLLPVLDQEFGESSECLKIHQYANFMLYF